MHSTLPREMAEGEYTDMMHTHPQITEEMTDTKLVCPVFFTSSLTS